jgi:hypothetical protein
MKLECRNFAMCKLATAQMWHTHYHDIMRYLCSVRTRSLTPNERTDDGIANLNPICRAQ